MKRTLNSIFLSLVVIALPASGAIISFEEFPADNDNGPMPAGRYSSLGITFGATDDGSTWGGLDNSDPGNWGLLGTNGSTFSGFNGDSYGLTTTFATDVSGFSLDVSRSNGSEPGQIFTLQGYNNSVLVDSVTVTLGEINSWTSVSLAGVIDETRWIGDTRDTFNPYGVDNVSWKDGDTNNVPESGSSLAIFGLTLAGLVGIRRKFGV